MASASKQSSYVELRGSEVVRPSPLRIVKRDQAVTSSPSPGAFLDRRQGLSGRPYECRGSPPAGADRPLTVRKTRKSRGTILNGSLEEISTERSPVSAVMELIERNSPWRAKNDYPDATSKSSRIVRGNNDTPIPEDPIRLSLRSKSFFLKAIPGPNSSAQKAMRRISSNVSKRIKRPPRAERHSSGFYCGDGNLTSSAMSCSDCQDVPAVSMVSRRISFHDDNNIPSLLTLDSPYKIDSQGPLILCPKIDVTPELSIVDTSACSLWIAIEVTGLLRRADGQEEYGNGADRYPSRPSTQLSDLRCYGHLHAMRIDLFPGRDCTISEIFGDLRDLKTLRAKETFLVLAKVRLGTIISWQENAREAAVPDDLIAGLESDLSNITAPYLMIRVTYKHSGLLEQLPSTLPTETGMSKFSTRMQSEATVVIQRTNLQSQWSPRATCTINGPAHVNPLIKIIETHFPVEIARSALRKLANDRVHIPQAKRHHNDNESGEPTKETVKLPDIKSLATRLNSIVATPLNLDLFSIGDSTNCPDNGNWSDEGDRDPARKIWTEIRRTSRGGRDLDDSLIQTSTETAVEDERNRIKETALKNKRSLGEDSLRSMAPSVSSVDTKPAAFSTGLGLSMGNRWGWGGSWW